MNYERDDLLEPLAAGFTTGLLRGRARSRFEKLCERLPRARAARHRWEDRLLPLALALPQQQPGSDCWNRIAQSLGHEPIRPRSATGMAWWKVAAAASVLIAALVTTQIVMNRPDWQPMAQLAAANAAPQWRLERTPDGRRMMIRALGTIDAAGAGSYELWILPVGGGNPTSLGVLPVQGDVERTLTPEQTGLLLMAMQVAVSVEPSGGSPTGLPTGPVIMVAPLTAS